MTKDPRPDQVFDDIANAVLALRRAFRLHRLAPPVRLELGAPEDMRRLRASIPGDMVASLVTLGPDDVPVITLNICGTEIVSPAERRAVRNRHGDIGWEYE